MKTSSDYLKEAEQRVPRVSFEEGMKKFNEGNSVFIDVRDSSEIKSSGTIKGALKIPRGFIEFAADDSTPYFDKNLSKDKEIFLVCGAGGQAALSGFTLKEMGYEKVFNLGGIGDWIKSGGPSEND